MAIDCKLVGDRLTTVNNSEILIIYASQALVLLTRFPVRSGTLLFHQACRLKLSHILCFSHFGTLVRLFEHIPYTLKAWL